MFPTPFLNPVSTTNTADALREASCALKAVSSLLVMAEDLETLSDEDRNGLSSILDAVARTMDDAGERYHDEYQRGYQAALRDAEVMGALPSNEPAGAGDPPEDRSAGDDGATYPKVPCTPSDDPQPETGKARRRSGRARRSA